MSGIFWCIFLCCSLRVRFVALLFFTFRKRCSSERAASLNLICWLDPSFKLNNSLLRIYAYACLVTVNIQYSLSSVPSRELFQRFLYLPWFFISKESSGIFLFASSHPDYSNFTMQAGFLTKSQAINFSWIDSSNVSLPPTCNFRSCACILIIFLLSWKRCFRFGKGSLIFAKSILPRRSYCLVREYSR